MSGRGEERLISKGWSQDHRYWQLFVFNLLPKYLNGIGPNTLAYIYIYTYSHTHVDASAKLNKTCYAETCGQASTTCVCSDNSTHNLSTKARHFRVRGRYVLDKVKRLDFYKNHHLRLLANTIHASLMAKLYKSLQNKTNWLNNSLNM